MLEKIVQSAKSRFGKSLRYIFIALVVLLSISLIRNIIKISQVRRRIDEEAARIEGLKEENLKLQKRLEDIQSDRYIESELRDKLGLAKGGETILVLPEENVVKSLAPESSDEQEALPEPNWKKWVMLFF